MKHEKYTYSPYQINSLKLWRKHLKENEPLLIEKIQKIIKRYSSNERATLPKEEREIVQLEFFHGSGQLDFVFSAKTIKEEDVYLFGHDHLVPEYDWYQPKNNNFEYPDSLDIYYEEFRGHRAESEKWHLTFDWLVKNWVKLDGHKIGLICGTWQNNAASTFSFNLINWDTCIDLPEPELNKVCKYPLIRDLTDYEIESRIRFTSYHPFIQKFRYFENNNNEFYEIGYYSNIIGYRSGLISDYNNVPFKITEHKFDYRTMRFEQYKEIAIKVDELINIGFEELKKPNWTVTLHDELIEWEYGPFLREYEPISSSSIHSIEKHLENQIPKQYRWFLERMNNIKPVWEISNFRLGHRQWKKFKKIYNVDEIQTNFNLLNTNSLPNKEYFPFAEDTEGGFLLIKFKSGEIFHLQEELQKTHDSFQDFIMDCCSISEYFNPMRLHLENDNIKMLRKWISSGIDITDDSLFGGRKAMHISRDYEINELLCQHGADPNDFHLFSEMGAKYVKMLIRYGMDLKVKLEQQEWFKKVIDENEEYKEFRQLTNK